MENSKAKESELAIEQYGSMDKFVEDTKNNFVVDKDNLEYMSTIKKKDLDYYIDKDNKLYKIIQRH